MPLTLDTPEAVSTNIYSYEINAFSVDLDRGEIHVSYERKDDQGTRISDAVLTLADAEMQAAVARTSEIAGADVYAALKQALYEAIQSATGAAGTVA